MILITTKFFFHGAENGAHITERKIRATSNNGRFENVVGTKIFGIPWNHFKDSRTAKLVTTVAIFLIIDLYTRVVDA